MPVSPGSTNTEHQTAPDGTFRFTLNTFGPSGLIGLMAESDGGAHMGLDRFFDRRKAQRNAEPIRIALKPSRPVTVRVKDNAGAPVPGATMRTGATVEAAELAFRAHATSGLDGTGWTPHSG